MQLSPPLSPPLSTFDLATDPTLLSCLSGIVRHRSDAVESSNQRETKRRRNNEDGPRAPELTAHWRSLNDLATNTHVQPSSQQPSSLQLRLDDLLSHHIGQGWDCTMPSRKSAAFDYLSDQDDSKDPRIPPTPSLSIKEPTCGYRPVPARSLTLPQIFVLDGTEPNHRVAGVVARDATLHNSQPSQYGSALPLRRQTDPPAAGPAASASLQKDSYVSGLVGASVIAIESIWGVPIEGPSKADNAVLPLTWFIREVLRRSRTSCSTLQVSLYYLHKCRREIRDSVARAETSAVLEELSRQTAVPADCMEQDTYPSPPHTPVDSSPLSGSDRYVSATTRIVSSPSPILCGRRMFLAALICASKFLQDQNYSNRAWAKISGLTVQEINENERVFLGLMKFDLHLGADDFHKWTTRLASLAMQGAALDSAAPSPAAASSRVRTGLNRHASEYPPAPPLQHCQMATTAPLPPRAPAQLGRARSHPSAPRRSTTSLAPPQPELLKAHAPARMLATPDTSPEASLTPVAHCASPLTMTEGILPSGPRRILPTRSSVRIHHSSRCVSPSPGSLSYRPGTMSSTCTVPGARPVAA